MRGPAKGALRIRMMLRLIALMTTLFASAVQADGWETFSHDMGHGAAVCPYDDPESGRFFCFALACPPEGGMPLIRIAFAGAEISQFRAPLSVRVDGQIVSHLFLERLTGSEDQDYGTPFVPDRDAVLVEALKTGTRATIVFGIGLSAIVETISLLGSHAALEEVPVLCNTVMLSAPAN